MPKVLTVLGTRPEAIKMAPIIKVLRDHAAHVQEITCVTGQHRELVDDVLRFFDVVPKYDLDLMMPDQALPDLTAKALGALTEVIVRENPDMVLVQGDTTTAMAASLAAFYQRVPVGHVEAGLRTHNRYRPFPEEINRRLISVLATFHFAPTQRARETLLLEGIPPEQVYLTGNPVVDALLMVLDGEPNAPLPRNPEEAKLILVTAHRRESVGRSLQQICQAVEEIAARNSDVEILYPVHPNPNVHAQVHALLSGKERVNLVLPMLYPEFVRVMARSYLILTDSGGIQEEAPVLGRPVLIMREETERVEGILEGNARVVGADAMKIIAETERLLHDRDAYEGLSKSGSPYGDGKAADRIVRIILEKLGNAPISGGT
jgi:UDP-N-acetylglucosamine 2-epimerase (non-hydrolysing)